MSVTALPQQYCGSLLVVSCQKWDKSSYLLPKSNQPFLTAHSILRIFSSQFRMPPEVGNHAFPVFDLIMQEGNPPSLQCCILIRNKSSSSRSPSASLIWIRSSSIDSGGVRHISRQDLRYSKNPLVLTQWPAYSPNPYKRGIEMGLAGCWSHTYVPATQRSSSSALSGQKVSPTR